MRIETRNPKMESRNSKFEYRNSKIGVTRPECGGGFPSLIRRGPEWL